MKHVILWNAVMLLTFAAGVGADRLWWQFRAAPPPTPKVETLAVDVQPQKEIVYVPAPPAPAEAPQSKPTLILDYDPLKFSAWGAFYVTGSKPKEFSDFDSLEISLNQDAEGTITLFTHDGDEYDSAPATFALVTKRRLFFTTSKLEKGDFEYRFDGQFLRTDFDAVAGKNQAVLRGTLTKMKNGRTIAEHEFTFHIEHMGC